MSLMSFEKFTNCFHQSARDRTCTCKGLLPLPPQGSASAKFRHPSVLPILLRFRFYFNLCILHHANISHLTTDFFGCLFSDVVELGATNFGTFDHFNLVDHRRIEWEDFFHPHTRGHSSHGEGG